jgi:pimeloyl-ACP methyl ester carboxylesterase
VLLSPYFDELVYRHWRDADRSGECLLRMLEHARGLVPGMGIDRVFLFGHSAGGQFAHRFAMRHPGRIAKGFSSGAGNYTFARDAGDGYQLDGFLAADFVIGVGEFDTNPERMGGRPEQGANRIERAHNFHRSLVRYGGRRGLAVRPRVMVVAGAGHSGAQTSPAAREFFGALEFADGVGAEVE